MANEMIRAPSMAIKNLRPQLPERGKIKIGRKGKMVTSRSGTEFQPPEKLDRFLVTTLNRSADGNFEIDVPVMEMLGASKENKLVQIPIRLLYDDPNLNMPTRYACFKGRTVWCTGDGETAQRRMEDGSMRAVPCTCERQDPTYSKPDKCKINGVLSVVIRGAGGIGGVWKFRTTSYNSVVGILSSMSYLATLTGGPLAGLPLMLTVQPKVVSNPVDGKQQTVYVCGLVFDGADEDALITAGHRVALQRAQAHIRIELIEDEARRVLALPSPADFILAGESASDVAEEFYSEGIANAPPRPRRADFVVQPTSAAPEPEYDPDTGEIVEEGDHATGLSIEEAMAVIETETTARDLVAWFEAAYDTDPCPQPVEDAFIARRALLEAAEVQAEASRVATEQAARDAAAKAAAPKPTPTPDPTSPKMAGAEAFRAGKQLIDNPYPKASTPAEHWRKSWLAAQSAHADAQEAPRPTPAPEASRAPSPIQAAPVEAADPIAAAKAMLTQIDNADDMMTAFHALGEDAVNDDGLYDWVRGLRKDLTAAGKGKSTRPPEPNKADGFWSRPKLTVQTVEQFEKAMRQCPSFDLLVKLNGDNTLIWKALEKSEDNDRIGDLYNSRHGELRV